MRPDRRALDREIRRLSLPALGALIAEPLFLLTDTALVGHLGGEALAAVSVASALLQTIVGLLIFLAYSTTPTVARRVGAGDIAGAVKQGIDGIWLALLMGAVIVLAGIPLSGWLVGLFGVDGSVRDAAVEYLAISLIGVPAILVTFAATGLLRGLQDTRTPLVVAGVGFAANAGLNVLFIYGLGWGVAGSAWGSTVAKIGMALAYFVVVLRVAAVHRASLVPDAAGVRRAAHAGSWLFLRTAALRAAMLATVFVATRLGIVELAATQIGLTIFATLAFVLDALAIAGQAMVGKALGAADVPGAGRVTRRLVQLGVGAGVVLGVLVAATSLVLGPVFTSDPSVQRVLPIVLLIIAASVPLGGLVFVLDGVLIGAGDARYLAIAGVVNLVVYLPLLALVVSLTSGTVGLAPLWLAFGFGYFGARALTLGLRARTDRWLVPGVR